MAGRAEIADRLSGDLIADAGRLRQTGWRPVETTGEALSLAALSFVAPMDSTRH
jgi:hypothetical protein